MVLNSFKIRSTLIGLLKSPALSLSLSLYRVDEEEIICAGSVDDWNTKFTFQILNRHDSNILAFHGYAQRDRQTVNYGKMTLGILSEKLIFKELKKIVIQQSCIQIIHHKEKIIQSFS